MSDEFGTIIVGGKFSGDLPAIVDVLNTLEFGDIVEFITTDDGYICVSNFPFHQIRFPTLTDAFRRSFNERFWRHGIVISQGNGMNVPRDEAVRRLDSIRHHLARKMFGNHWREKAKITFVLFKHGSSATEDEHYHALLGIAGNHEWSDFRIAMTVKSIEFMRHRRRKPNRHWEKMAHVDWDWEKGNRYHRYVSRFANKRPDDWYLI
jgi:hypothetical protein